jgi:predicted pyridoxine 5'-phosphate oxidase superfamily flavin-nucleotide-binding protein
MSTVPERARNLMSPGKVMALATASADGEPNVAPMQQCWWYTDDTMVIGDLFMKQTRANIEENGRACFTVWENDPREGYKYTGAAHYLTSGAEYDMANGELKKKMPEKNFKGVVVIKVEKVFDIKSGPTAGQLITE